MGYFAMLTPHEQLVDTVLHIDQTVNSRACRILVPELSVGHYKLQVDHVEYHCYKLNPAERKYAEFRALCFWYTEGGVAVVLQNFLWQENRVAASEKHFPAPRFRYS